jgi:carnosine synthase
MSVPIAARLAEALNLPGNPVAAVDAARDKFATRAIMQDAGLATPANKLIEKEADLDAAAAAVGFPAVRLLVQALLPACAHACDTHCALLR